MRAPPRHEFGVERAPVVLHFRSAEARAALRGLAEVEPVVHLSGIGQAWPDLRGEARAYHPRVSEIGDVLAAIEALSAKGERMALATIVAVRGLLPNSSG